MLKEDQILRAMGMGDTLATNPRAYHLRVRYHKMYYYYKPGKVYWILVILARKVGIAFCALIFRTNPGFMLASVLLVLFIAFSLQTRHSPYMSTSQRQIVLAEHSIKAESGDRTHQHIQKNIEHVKMSQSQKKRSQSNRTKQALFTGTVQERMDDKASVKSNRTEYFFDYNTVELALLFCAVLVCLAGVMFESDRFKATDNDGSLRYAWQRDLVTYIVIFIVLCSFVYLGIVMANEITGWTPDSLRKCFKNKRNALMSAAETIQEQKDDQIEMSMINPSLVGDAGMGDAERARLKQEIAHQEEQRKIMDRQAAALAQERRKFAGLVAAQKTKGSMAGKRRGRGRGKLKKTEFGAPRSDRPEETAGLTAIDLKFKQNSMANGKPEGDGAGTPVSHSLVLQPQLSSTPTGKLHKKSRSFRKHTSAEGKTYYADTETEATTWTLPEDAILL